LLGKLLFLCSLFGDGFFCRGRFLRCRFCRGGFLCWNRFFRCGLCGGRGCFCDYGFCGQALGCGLLDRGLLRCGSCGGAGEALKLGGVRVEEAFDLADEHGGLHGLNEHFVGSHVGPIVVGEGGEEGDGGMVGGGAGGLYDVAAGGFGLHAHVGDDHLVLIQLDFGLAFAGGGGGVDIKAGDFKDGLEGEEDGNFVVDEKGISWWC
jgi:hypothetical protein